MTNNLKQRSKNIEAIYPLAPMQQGLLFHTLMNPAQGMYLLQYRHVMKLENLNMDAFQRAWDAVVQRHELLRTSFVWKKQSRPLQVVHKNVKLPIELVDWSEFCKDKQEEKLEELLQEEREQELAFTKAPLMRVRLIKLAPNTYQFVRSYHHILMDAWCFSIIMMDFLNFYRAFEQGKSLSLATPRAYQDFIQWLGEQDPDKHQAFWESQLKGFDTPTPLGIRNIGQAVEGDSVVDVVSLLTKEQSHKIQEVAKATQVTVNTLLQGAWAMLLAQYSGNRDIAFGVTVAGRPTHMTGIESIVGLFINTLPLRVNIDSQVSLKQWLQALQSTNLSLREHETSSLTDIQGWSEIDQQDLFQSLFVFENAPMDAALSQENLEFIVEEATNRTHTNYPITVVIIPGESLHLQITYQASDFKHQDVENMLAHFQKLIIDMSDTLTVGDCSIDQISMLSTAEFAQQQQWGSGDELDLSWDYIQRFEQQAKRLPQKIAAADNTVSLDYQTLNNRVNLLAKDLIVQGISTDDVVAILAERGVELLIMIMASLKAGAAYLPLDPKHPAARSAQIIEQSGAVLLLVSDAQSDALVEINEEINGAINKKEANKATAINIITFSIDKQALVECANPNIKSYPDQLAYIIFTSGSTGTPKGAMVTRQGMLNNMLGKFAPLALSGEDIIAQTASQCFDISVWQFLIAPILGARVEILPDCISQDPITLSREISKRGISILEPVPALLQSIVEQQQSLDSLRWVIPTGEALPPSLIEAWYQSYPNIPLMNAYGPAECSDDVAFYPVEKSDTALAHVPIGSPTANNKLYILSPQLEQMPIGAIGEIYVAGTGVGRGYRNEPKRSAAVFLPNPFTSECDKNRGERLYRTGDLGRFLADGNIQYVGRSDYQVKVRGYRIELGEIESRIANYPGVNEVVVIATDNAQRGTVLVAYMGINPESDQPAIDTVNGMSEQGSWSSLKDFIKESLPEYMVPSAFVALDKLPRNSNGKVARAQLPPVDFSAQSVLDYVAPRNELEEKVCDIWQSLLMDKQNFSQNSTQKSTQEKTSARKIGIKDNFFELGGHSLLATQLVGRLSQLLSADVSLRSIFEQPTIIDWLAWWEAQSQSQELQEPAALTQLPELTRLDTQTSATRLSFVQQRLWFLQGLTPDSASYNLPTALRLSGEIDVSKITSAINKCIKRHDILRSYFEVEEGTPVQKLSPVFSALFAHRQVACEAELNRCLQQDAMTPFVLARAPLLRFSIYAIAGKNNELVLSINCHHIIADAWSLHLLIEEFCHYYNTEALAIEYTDTIRYSDYALWQRQCLENGFFDEQLNYWKNILSGELPVLELNYDFKRPTEPTFAGARHAIRLPKMLAMQLRKADKNAKRSHFVSLLGAFQLLLNAYSGQSDIVIGIPIANRHHHQTQETMGCFVNTIVQRANLQPQHTVSEFLQSIAEQSINAQANQDLPFDYLIEQLGVDRQLSYNPLFQVMFNYLSEKPLNQFDLKDLSVEVIHNRSDTVLCDFKLDVQASGDNFDLQFEYSTELFEEASVIAIAEDYQRVLQWLLENEAAQTTLAAIDIWQENTERDTQVQASPLNQQQLIEHDLLNDFQSRVSDQADNLAIQGKSGTLSYQELDALSNHIANQLISKGVEKYQRVAICVERDISMITSMLAILKIGATYIPIDPNWPAERAAYIVEHSQTNICLVDQVSHDHTKALTKGLNCLFADVSLSATSDSTTTLTSTAITPQQTAYILYTSGSTGKPKGVSVNRGNLSNLFVDLQQRLGLKAKQQVLALSSYCFDISIVELLLPLTQGASIVIADKDQTRDPKLLAELLEQCKSEGRAIDLMQATPATWSMLIAQSKLPLKNTTLLSCGEALGKELAKKLLSTGKQLFNIYGPTEVTVYSTYKEITRIDEAPISIGYDGFDVQSYILDSHLKPVPQGVIGELYLAGANVTNGYVNAPALTASAFLPNPFAQQQNRSGDRLYKTGDLVRRNKDNEIEYIGRNDFQVKLRGFRIELGEIESLLSQLAFVENVAVILNKAKDDTQQENDRLIAYWSGTKTDSKKDNALMREQLINHLPEYMVPNIFQHLEELPLNSSAKVDRKALLAIEPELEQKSDNPVAMPESIWEQRLLVLWQQLFNRQNINREDDFFELGGHSLLVARLVARLQEEYAIELPLKSVFETSVLASLAKLIEATANELHSNQAIVASDQTDHIPMYATQQRLWFMEQFNGAGRAYQLSSALKIKGQLDHNYLNKALVLLANRQHSLRTVFGDIDGALFQSIKASIDIRLRIHQLELESNTQNTDLNAQLEALASEPFDLSNEPAWRVDLYEINGNTQQAYSVIQLCIHHIIADAWSLDIFLKELQALYQGVKSAYQLDYAALEVVDKKAVASLPELPFQFKDFSLWSKSEIAKEAIDKDAHYWQVQLAGESPILDLPTDFPRPKQQSFTGNRYRFSLPKALVSQLNSVSAQNNLTVFIPLLSAWQLLLSRYSGQEDIRVGIPVANRHRSHTHQLIGYFASTQVIKSPLNQGASVLAHWRALRHTLIDAQQHQSLPFEQLVEMLNVSRSTSHSPLFQTLFNLIQLPSEQSMSFDGIEAARLPIEDGTSITDISLQIEATDNDWDCVLEYNTDLFLPATAERYAKQYTDVLAQMLNSKDSALAALTVLNDADKHSLIALNGPNKTSNTSLDDFSPQNPQESFIAHFEQQVSNNPDNIAIHYQDKKISYAELSQQSNYLAERLHEYKLNADERIAVCLERTPLLLITLIAIQKIGAAYIPLDPMQPAQRLSYICEHAKPTLLITESHLDNLLASSSSSAATDQLTTILLSEGYFDCLHTDKTLAENYTHKPFLQNLPANRLAYVIYTSGSTGKPKGVAVTQDNLSNFLKAMDNQLALTATDNWLAVTTASFDISALEFYLPLMKGASITLASTRESMDGELLFALLQQATVLQATPTTWQLLLGQKEGQAEQKWPAIRGLVGGEAVPESLANKLLEKSVDLINVYGPTETTIWSTLQAVSTNSLTGQNAIVPIGLPILNTQCYVLDKYLNLVPQGVSGELYIAGAGVARGYHDAARLSANAFVPNPFSCDGSRMYKTGDVVKWNAQGTLDYIGRRDFQVKVRGYRIELGEIESCLCQQAPISEAVVVTDKRQNLVGLIKVNKSDSQNETEQELDTLLVKKALEAQLPAYMVPQRITVIEQFPLNSNGKIDRKALAVIADKSAQHSRSIKSRPPETDVEKRLASLWNKLLNVDPGVEDNFFELGGHSLLAMQLITQVEKEFSTKLSLQSLFENPTVSALAEQLKQSSDENHNKELDLIDQLLSEFEG